MLENWKDYFCLMNRRRGVVIIAILLVFSFLVYKIANGFKELNDASKNQLASTYTLPEDDYAVLSDKYIENIKVNEVIRNGLRNPIALCDYDSSFTLIICKINLRGYNYDFTPNKEFWKIDESVGVPYENVKNERFTLQFQVSKVQDTAVKLRLSYNDSLVSQKMDGDSIRYLRLNDDRFAISYGTDSPKDFILTIKNHKIDLIFLKRKKDLFSFFLFSNRLNDTIPDGLLYKIVTGR